LVFSESKSDGSNRHRHQRLFLVFISSGQRRYCQGNIPSHRRATNPNRLLEAAVSPLTDLAESPAAPASRAEEQSGAPDVDTRQEEPSDAQDARH
jgi:hypothetical protein